MQKSMINQGILNEDRISELPEALLVLILSLLPTEDAIATSVLSKQWQSLWKLLPKLKFNSHHHSNELGTFSKNVCKVLLSHKAPVLQSLRLMVCLEMCNAMDTEKLIETAFARNVRELVLHAGAGEWLLYPKTLYISETLETLELKFFVLVDVPSSVLFKSLRTLRLHYVDFKNDESVFNLLSGCPNLENLLVHRDPFNSTVKTLIIAVPSLQRLTIYNYSNKLGYVIKAPSLKYLKIVGNLGDGSCLIENNTTELVEANIIHVINEKLMKSLTSVKRLSLQVSALKFPTGRIFYQLEYLELCINYAAWWNLLTLMLDSSPKLQVLKLIDPQLSRREDLGDQGKWNQPNNVAECLLRHLKTFVLISYKEELKEEIEVAKYILKNANCLKKATFSIKGLNSDKRVEMLEELESVVRVSNSSCQLLLLCK
ncbi:putative F-box/FBD/LRR-repeat protein [Cardamine amara subsp. amara]|uniref:F-box/FBD/LRR-repeat protein n=1 Tax=Cardamine amara subsp. amara TaxID=228776 RepID=A0ABD1AV16_CARAN